MLYHGTFFHSSDLDLNIRYGLNYGLLLRRCYTSVRKCRLSGYRVNKEMNVLSWLGPKVRISDLLSPNAGLTALTLVNLCGNHGFKWTLGVGAFLNWRLV